MVLLPVRKCYYMAKVCAVVGLVVTVLGMFEYWRGGRRSVRATAPEFSDAESAEFERQIRADEARIIPGLGEGGAAAELSGVAKRLGDESVKKNAVNVYLSDRISYTRSLADLRHPACNNVVYDAELPSASVILIFHNEPYSVVVRTIWSVINSARRDHDFHQRANFRHSSGRTMKLGYPGQDESSPFVYLKELILVDDNSTLLELKGKLSYYVRTRLPPDLVKILRLPDRVGLTRARLAGARRAAGDVLVFLDAHCEAQRDWLRPLLQRIGDSRTAVVMPVIDVVEATNFYYSVADPADFEIGGFSFNGHFQWIDVPERERQRRGSLVGATWSPTMAGGLFAIERNYFWELGAYDEQMGGWGGENLEISFRIWMCGGTLETVPCSRVGHVFRSFHPYGLPASTDTHGTYGLFASSNTHGINTARMAEVWMDDYKELFYLHRPDLRKNPKVGDVTHRKVLREKLHCKDFQWYLDTVYPQKFVPVRDTFGYGRFQNPSSGMCLDNLQHDNDHDPLGVYPCHSTISESQYYALSYSGELRTENGCADVKHSRHDRERSAVEDDAQRTVVMSSCRARLRPTPTWQYLPTKQLLHVASGLCLEASPVPSSHAYVTRCRDAPAQTWLIDYSELNHFQRDNDLISREQEEALSKIRTSRNLTRNRVSRSLMAYEGEEKDDLEALSESSGSEGGTGGEDVPAPAPTLAPTRAPAPAPSRRRNKHKHKKAKKHGKAKRTRPKTKNMFILKLVRTLMNNTEEHLEVKIQCKHRRLFPNNTFVRDLVTILNEKNIKVINNGRVFERNRVSELAPRKHPKKVLEKLDIGAPPDAPPAPQPPAAEPPEPEPPAQHPPVLRHLPQQRPSATRLDVAQQAVPELAPLAMAPYALAPPAALASARDELLDGRAGGKHSRPPPPIPHAVLAPPAQPPQRPVRPAPPPPQQRHDDFEKRIIVEEFVEVRPKSPAPVVTQPSNSPLARASKKRRRKPMQALPSPPPTATPSEAPSTTATPPQNIDVRPLQQGVGQSDRGSSGVNAGAGELVYKQAQEAPAYGPDQELAAGKQLLITLFNHNKPHQEPDRSQPASTRDGVLETAEPSVQRARGSADIDVSAERNSVGGSDVGVFDAGEDVVPSQSEDEASREAPPAAPALPEPELDGGGVSARRDSQSTSPFEEDAVLTGGGVLARSADDEPVPRTNARPPLKVVMRSNLTFNLGEEFFKWRSRDDDLTSLLGELSIPTNSSIDEQHAAPRAKPRPALPRSPVLAAPHKLLKAVLSSSTDNEDSSSSDSSSAGS